MKKKMKICVFGGAGYIGSHVVNDLIKEKHEIFIFDNFSTGRKNLFKNKNIKIINCDITNFKKLNFFISKEIKKKSFDIFMHFAAKIVVEESMKKPDIYYFNNVIGMKNLLDIIVKFGIKNIIFSSTAAVYGDTNGKICNENFPLKPINVYGETKLVCEKMIQWYSKAYNFNYCIFRYFNVAGAHKNLKLGLINNKITHIIPVIIETVLGIRKNVKIFGNNYKTFDGTCIRDYIHVLDLSKAHILGMKYIIKNNKSLLINLGSNKGFSVKNIIETVLKIFPKLKYEISNRRKGDPAFLVSSNELAYKILGWKPIKTLKDMINSDLKFRKNFFYKNKK